jgi:hypothetical protein
MTKIAFIDLDGVVADATKRFERADIAKALYLSGTDRPEMLSREATNVYWREVFNSENVPLDTLIEGVVEALVTLEQQDYRLIYLTSRPESMRAATQEWLFQKLVWGVYDLPNFVSRGLVMKPAAFQYTKTVIWKAGTIQMFVAMYGADEVLVIDDEPVNLAELMKYDTAHWRMCASLAEAARPTPEVTPNDHPF